MYTDNGQAGHFTVTFSAYAQLQPGEGVWLHLAHQEEEVVIMMMMSKMMMMI